MRKSKKNLITVLIFTGFTTSYINTMMEGSDTPPFEIKKEGTIPGERAMPPEAKDIETMTPEQQKARFGFVIPPKLTQKPKSVRQRLQAFFSRKKTKPSSQATPTTPLQKAAKPDASKTPKEIKEFFDSTIDHALESAKLEARAQFNNILKKFSNLLGESGLDEKNMSALDAMLDNFKTKVKKFLQSLPKQEINWEGAYR